MDAPEMVHHTIKVNLGNFNTAFLTQTSLRVALNFVQNCVFLTFIGQAGCSSPVKCNSVWMKGKALSHSCAGMGI